MLYDIYCVCVRDKASQTKRFYVHSISNAAKIKLESISRCFYALQWLLCNSMFVALELHLNETAKYCNYKKRCVNAKLSSELLKIWHLDISIENDKDLYSYTHVSILYLCMNKK